MTTQTAGGGGILGEASPPAQTTVEQMPPAPVLPATAEGFGVAGTAGEGARLSPSPAPSLRMAETQSERVVRLALDLGRANMRLDAVQAVVDTWDDTARERLLVALAWPRGTAA